MVIQSLPALPSDAITVKNNRPVTTSLKVAEAFGKQHKDVLRAIRELDLPGEWAGRNFAPGSYLDAQGQDRPAYDMTRDGFVLLVMGFTGRQAMACKLAYIEAFNAMEAELADKKAAKGTGDPIADMLLEMVAALPPLDMARLLVVMNSEKFWATLPERAAQECGCAGQHAARREVAQGNRLTTSEAAARLGVCYRTIMRREQTGQLHPVRTPGRRVFWDAGEVAKMLA